PEEDEQYEAYRDVVEGMKGLPVTIRTLDIGADKNLDGEGYVAVNPALGLRAIRYCLAEPLVFNTQLRAILRASRHGKVLILVPMLTTYHELQQALAAVHDLHGAAAGDGRRGHGEGAAARRGREVRRVRAGGRHDRGAGGGDRS